MAADGLRAPITLRPAVLRDVAAMHRLELDAGQMFHDVDMPSIADAAPSPDEVLEAHVHDGTAWMAVDVDDLPVAYAISSIVDGEGHLDQVSVSTSVAGQRIGRRLIDHVCAWALDRELDAVTLTTFVDVPFNGPLYERYGFVFLTDDEMGPELRSIREAETDAGIDVGPRAAMRLVLPAVSGRS